MSTSCSVRAPRHAVRPRRRLTTVRLIREGTFVAPEAYPPQKVPIRNAQDVYAHMAPYAIREATEAFWILPLNIQSCLATPGPVVITRGTIGASLVHPREVFAAAVVAHAASIVLVHNHPSGDPSPSREDYEITQQLVACGVVLGIPVQDHVIVGFGRYMSLMEEGMLVQPSTEASR